MNITDDTLSAFLDQELSAQEMGAVRDAIAEDEALGDRLAALASADARVKQHAAAIDAMPMPSAITDLLKETGNVVHLSLWQRSKHVAKEHMAMAASLTLVVGFVAGYVGLSSQNTQTQVFASLQTVPSGQTATLDNNASLLPRFSFLNKTGQYCRQYQLQTEDSVTENIACRTQEDWQVLASADTGVMNLDDGYIPATGTSLLDSTLDALMADSPLSLEQERAAMQQEWSVPQ